MRLLTLSMALGLFMMMENPIRAQTAETQAQVDEALIKERKKAAQAQVDAAEKAVQAAKEALANRKNNNAEQAKERELSELKAQERAATPENMLAQALRNNPDIRVAEAKMREAEAELNRTRMVVAQKVMAYRADHEAAKALYEEANAKFLRADKLYKSGALPMEELGTASSALAKVKADLARVEAQLPFLLGKISGPISSLNTVGELSNAIAGQLAVDENSRRALEMLVEQIKNNQDLQNKDQKINPFTTNVFNPFAGIGQSGPGGGVGFVGGGGLGQGSKPRMGIDAIRPEQSLPPGMADKIRKALDTPGRPNFTKATPKHILDYLQGQTGGLTIFGNDSFIKNDLDLNLQEAIPMGAIFQFLEDRLGWRFVIRDYGIVASQQNDIPPGAVELLKFWKMPPAKTKSP